MPKLGPYSYPEVKLSRALEVAEKIAREFKGRASVASLATGLEMAERGGGFARLVAALRDYGLVDGRGDLSVTPLAESVVYAETGEAASAAKAQAFLGVELFRKLAEKIGEEVPGDARFRATVQEITRENLTTINSRLPALKSLWADGVELVGNFARNAPVNVPDEARIATRSAGPAAGGSGIGDFVEFRSGDNYIRLKKDLSEIDLALKLLSVVREQLREGVMIEPKALPAPVNGESGASGF